MNKYERLAIACIIIIINIISGHFFPPFGILLSPIFTSVAVGVIHVRKPAFNSLLQALLSFALIALNDIGIKIFAGGKHDNEGQGVVNLFFIISLMPCFGILLFYIIKDKVTPLFVKLFSIILFILSSFFYLQLFGWLGLEK